MYVHTCYKTIVFHENKKTNNSYEKIEIPPAEIQITGNDYSKLDSQGIVFKGATIYKGDVIVGKTLTKIAREEEKSDCSLKAGIGEDGIVDDIWDGLTEVGTRMIKIKIRQIRIPEVADKFASRSSQKGVCGQMIRQEDMPFTKDGIVPDLIMSTLSLPSRMTIAQLLESLYGKVCCFTGTPGDGTTFSKEDINPVEKIAQQLEAHGFQRYGEERMYSGYSGEMLDASIFIGPTYYQRLKHLVRDKMHCLTLDHEVLTIQGWKSIGDVTLNDDVATLTSGGHIIYQKPTKLYNYPDYEGSIYEVRGRNIDLIVTGNHRMWVKMNSQSEYGFQTAENVYKSGRGKEVEYKHDGYRDVEAYMLPSISQNPEDMFNFIHLTALYYDCGFMNEFRGISFYADEKGFKFLRTFCKLYKFEYHWDGSQFICNNDVFVRVILDNIPSRDYYVEWLFYLNLPQLGVFLSVLFDFPRNLTYLSETLNKSNQLQQLCFHAGLSTHVLKKNSGYLLIVDNVNDTYKTTEISWEKYTEKMKIPVACISVPNEIFYVRRNGKAVWTGNSRAHGNMTMMTKQPSNGRAQDGG